jgi:cell fate (sporulation/competence/biofilm development) regulator YlbF (YheA/YmcA/DUF963 family)
MLKADPTVQAYLEAKSRAESDSQAITLEVQYKHLYESLVARQKSGQELDEKEIDAFYALQAKVRAHPLIAERNACLSSVQRTFEKVNRDISRWLDIDYVTLAEP